MRHLFGIFIEEFMSTIRRLERILSLVKKSKVNAYLDKLKLQIRLGESWVHYESNQAFRKRVYHTYKEYVSHQKSKLELMDLSDYDIKYRQVLRERVKKLNLLHKGMTALCLAARIGTEVKSFLDLGYFAIGIDLNPGENNRYVVHGDFHDIQFPPNSVDVVFTNSLDHVYDIKKVINEIRRVLRPKGFLIIEVVSGSGEGKSPDFYESFWW
ncbi:MAG: methyltransferase domain-containing protein [Candidatus Aenigmarchaeota archaeon]|nr:methyltransferase domain-containing protein [Candidatus Aenigmarchaeota archaeon]